MNDQREMAKVLLDSLIKDYDESLTRIKDGMKTLQEVLEDDIDENEIGYDPEPNKQAEELWNQR